MLFPVSLFIFKNFLKQKTTVSTLTVNCYAIKVFLILTKDFALGNISLASREIS